MNKEIIDKLKELKIENYIWVIYVGIIFFSWYSNSLERDYYVTGNREAKEKYREIIIGIFLILVIVYMYFLKSNYDDLKKLKPWDSKKKKDLANLSFIASALIFISGVIFLYIALVDDDLSVELAFN